MPVPGRQTTAFLVSNMDFTGPVVVDAIGVADKTVVMIIDACIGEGRTFNTDNSLIYSDNGATVTLLELATSTEDNIRSLIQSADVVHLAGGNTFYLLHQIRLNGVEDLLRARAEQDTPFFLVGESAGALVMGSDINHIAPLDNPNVPGLASTKGLNWCPDLLVPHYKGLAWGFGDAIDRWLESDPNFPLYTLLHECAGLCVTSDGDRFLFAGLPQEPTP